MSNQPNNQIQSQAPLLYTVPELAERLETSKPAIRALIRAGLLRALKLGSLKVTAKEVDRFLEENVGKDLTDPFNVKDIG